MLPQYLEYPLLVLQNFLLLLLLGLASSSLVPCSAAVAAYSVAISCVARGLVPRHIVLLAMVGGSRTESRRRRRSYEERNGSKVRRCRRTIRSQVSPLRVSPSPWV